MARAGIDHAHAHFATEGAELARLARRMGGPPYSLTTHAKDIYHEDVRPEDLRRKLGSALFVATVSEANRTYLKTVLNGQGHVHVVPNAVDLRRFGRRRAASGAGTRRLDRPPRREEGHR